MQKVGIAVVLIILLVGVVYGQIPAPPVIDGQFVNMRIAALDLQLQAAQNYIDLLRQTIQALDADNRSLRERLKKYEEAPAPSPSH